MECKKKIYIKKKRGMIHVIQVKKKKIKGRIENKYAADKNNLQNRQKKKKKRKR